MSWFVLVDPLEAKTETESGIIIHEDARKVEQIQNTVGRVLKVGTLAFKGKSESGISLADDQQKVRVGDCVLFARYTGQKIKLRMKSSDDREVVLLSDTDILAVVTEPDRIRFWL